MPRTVPLVVAIAAILLIGGGGAVADDPVVAPPELELSADVPQAFSVLGEAVHLHGGRLLAGMPGLDVGGVPEQGGAVIFVATGDAARPWMQEQVLVSASFTADQQSGRSVRLGDGLAFLGSPDRSDATDGGSPFVAVFRETPTGWVEQPSLAVAAIPPGSGFGSALDLDGTELAVGAPRLDTLGTDAGGVFVWTLAPDGTSISVSSIAPPSPTAGDRFGAAVALDGDLLAVGAPGDDEAGPDAGAVWIYRRASEGWTVESKIVGIDAGPTASFGAAIALDGDRIAIGAARAGTDGLVRILRRDPRGGWMIEATVAGLGPSETPRDTGHSVALDGDRLAVGQPAATSGGMRSGTVALWRRSGVSWTPEGVLRPSTPELLTLGAAVSLADGWIAGGMPLESPDAVHAGGVAMIDLDRDCDADGIADQFATIGGLVADCDGDRIPDNCELADDPALDCNANGVIDSCDIVDGPSEDLNLNGLPDECEKELVFEVPGIFEDVGDAIDAAPDGAVIDIEPGVYDDPVVLGATAITIRGSDDPFDPTILRGGTGAGLLPGPVVRIAGPAASECVLENLMIEDGRHAAPLPDDSTRTGGGGLLVIDGSPRFERVTIRNCAADIGGGVCLIRADVQLVDCEISENLATEAGGGLATIDGHPLIQGGRFEENAGGAFGGAIAIRSGTATIDGVEILASTATRGGGIHAAPSSDRSPVAVSQSFISLNLAETRGGGIEAEPDGPGVVVTGSIICENDLDEIAGPVTFDATSEVCQCASDLSGDGRTDGADLGLLLASFGSCSGYCLADIDGDGQVSGADLGLILAGWGPCD